MKNEKNIYLYLPIDTDFHIPVSLRNRTGRFPIHACGSPDIDGISSTHADTHPNSDANTRSHGDPGSQSA